MYNGIIHHSRITLFKVCCSLIPNYSILTLFPKPLIIQSSNCFHSSSLSNYKYDHLCDFSPYKPIDTEYNPIIISPKERRSIVLGLGFMIKNQHGFMLYEFSRKFCPFLLVKIMKMFSNRHSAFSFFKLVFSNDSNTFIIDDTDFIRSCCFVCHILALQGFRMIAQDVLSWVIQRVGSSRGKEVMEFMWSGHYGYESDFSVLDLLMRVFVNVEMCTMALDVVGIMRGIGLKPSLSALTSLFRLLIRLGDYGSVWKLIRDMFKQGPRPSNITLNVMIHGLCNKGLIQTGESLLHLMSKFSCEPDVVTYNTLINAYCIRGQTLDALNWIDLMVERGCSPSNATFSSIINALSKRGNIVEARNVFDLMQKMGVSPNTSVYNALLDGLVKAREIDQVAMVIEEMKSNNVKVDSVTYNTLIAGYYNYGRDDQIVIDSLLRDIYECGLLLEDCMPDVSVMRLCWAGRPDEAVDHLQDMLKKGVHGLTIISFNSIISAYSKNGFENKAFDVYRMMIEFDVTPSSSTRNYLLMCLSRNGKLKEAEEVLLGDMMTSEKEFRVGFTMILDGYFKNGDVMGAQRLWSSMKDISSTNSLDTVAFSAYVDGLCKAGLVNEAYNVFKEMKNKRIVPNNFTYSSLIARFCYDGNLFDALELEKEMSQNGLVPDLFTNNIIINGYCKQGNMNNAIKRYKEMHNYGLVPDIITYNTLIGGYCKRFDLVNADKVVHEMCSNGWNPDIITYNIRIHGFCRIRRMKQGILVFNELVSSSGNNNNIVHPNTVTYNTMLNAICNDIILDGSGRSTAKMMTAKLLKMAAFVPNIVTTNLLLSHLRKQGSSPGIRDWGQKISLEFDEITYRILERADRDIDLEADDANARKSQAFVNSLMHLITSYDYGHETETNCAIRMINDGRSVESNTCGHQQRMLEVNN